MRAAMERRLRALLRKTKTSMSKEGQEAFLGVLLDRITLKREYEEVFAEAENAEAFAAKIGLDDAQSALLISMQAQKDIFVPNPLLDNVLTVMFLAEVAWVLYDMWRHSLLAAFLVGLLLVDAVVHRVKYVSTAVGTWLSNKVVEMGFVDIAPLSGRIQMKKWQEQSWQLVIHVVAAAIEWQILTQNPWWTDTRTSWIPHPWTQKFDTLTEVLYVVQLMIWVYTCIIHRFFDERRKDYFVMYIHHVVTIALVSGSYSMMVLRIGVLVLYVHDVSDIFVDLLKMVNFLKLEDRRGWFGSEIAYGVCVLSWIYWRLYQYPFRVLKASFIDSFDVLSSCEGGWDCWWLDDLPGYWYFNGLLFMLLILHIYWAHLFFMLGYRIITESAREASRQEYEGDSDDETVNDIVAKARAANEGDSATQHTSAPGSSSGASEPRSGTGAGAADVSERRTPTRSGLRKRQA